MPHTNANTAPRPTLAAILPFEKSQALGMMIKITQNLLRLADQEAQAFVQNDMMTFTILQDEKAVLVDHYARASQEFRNNVERFRGVDKNLLSRLATLQNDLAEKTKNNNIYVENIYENAKNRAKTSLVTAQELGQARVFYPEDNAQTQEQRG